MGGISRKVWVEFHLHMIDDLLSHPWWWRITIGDDLTDFPALFLIFVTFFLKNYNRKEVNVFIFAFENIVHAFLPVCREFW